MGMIGSAPFRQPRLQAAIPAEPTPLQTRTSPKLVEQLGGEVVKVVFLMELAGLKGRERLNGYDVASVICYDGK